MSEEEVDFPPSDPNSRAGSASVKKSGLLVSEGGAGSNPNTRSSSPKTGVSTPNKSPGKRISALSKEEEGTVKELLYQCQKYQRDADVWKRKFEELQLQSKKEVDGFDLFVIAFNYL